MQRVIKTTGLLLLVGLTLTSLVRCGKKDDGTKGTESMATACFHMQTSSSYSDPYNNNYNYQNGQLPSGVPNNGYPNQQLHNGGACNYHYNVQGFTAYRSGNTTYNSGGWGSTAAAGCSQYQQLVYSPSKGLGCVDSNRIHESGIVVRYTLDRASNAFVPLPPRYTQPGYGGYQDYNNAGGGYNSTIVLRTCDASDPCPSNLYCKSPLGHIPTSGLGVCYHN